MEYREAEAELKKSIGEGAFAFLGPQIAGRMLSGIQLANTPPKPGYPDSFVVCAPILRGFEGFLKKLMRECDIPFTQKQHGGRIGIGGFFKQQGVKRFQYTLDMSRLPSHFTISPTRSRIISECYGVWGSQRNKYFHEPDSPLTMDINISHGNAVRLNSRLLKRIKDSYQEWITQ